MPLVLSDIHRFCIILWQYINKRSIYGNCCEYTIETMDTIGSIVGGVDCCVEFGYGADEFYLGLKDTNSAR